MFICIYTVVLRQLRSQRPVTLRAEVAGDVTARLDVGSTMRKGEAYNILYYTTI